MTSPHPFSSLGRRLRILRRPSEPIRPAAPRPVRRDCHGRIQSALLALAGPSARVTSESLKPWCSATFTGAQHRLDLHLTGPDAPARAAMLAGALPDHEFRLPGHLVADLAVDSVSIREGNATLALCILTIEDW